MDKITKRKIKNRISVQNSRDRQKKLISDLKQENLELKPKIENLLSINNSCSEYSSQLNEQNFIVSDNATNSIRIFQTEGYSNTFLKGTSALSPIILVICIIRLICFSGINHPLPDLNMRKLSSGNLPVLKADNYPALLNDNFPLILNKIGDLEKKENIEYKVYNIEKALDEVISIEGELHNYTITDNNILLLKELKRIIKEKLANNKEFNRDPIISGNMREKFLIDLYKQL